MRAAVLEFVSSAFEVFLHGGRDPELHRPSYEGPVKSLWRDSDNGVWHVIQPLHFSDDLRITLEAITPELITDDNNRMSVASYLFVRFEAAAQNGMNPDRIEIVG